MSTPSLLFGRSMMCPFEAITMNPRPRNLLSVRDLVGDSTMTSGLPAPLGVAARVARFAARGAPVAGFFAVRFFAARFFAPTSTGARATGSSTGDFRARRGAVAGFAAALVPLVRRVLDVAMVHFSRIGAGL